MMDRLVVTNPFDGSPVGEMMLSSERDVETALATAAKTHEANRKGLPKHERIAVSYTHLTLPTKRIV